jgi:mannonate dehydratase
LKMTFRWYGDKDPVSLEYIKQVPVIEGIVSALDDIPVGGVWPLEKIQALKDKIERAGFTFEVIESIPIHEDIKLGKPSRDKWIENYCKSIENMGQAGIPVLCYNFMPGFDWVRTDFYMKMADNSTVSSYKNPDLNKIDLLKNMVDLPGWATTYTAESLQQLLSDYGQVDEEKLWDNLAYFLEHVVPVAEKSNVKMAIHPDDPPWPVFGLPRIITNEQNVNRFLDLVDSPANGITFCTGSFGPNAENDLAGMVRRIGGRGKIHFAHSRNIKRTANKDFYECPHPGGFGDVNMLELMKAYKEVGFNGPMRPDHGRMIWGEQGRPGYGLYDRSLGAMYLYGLWEAQ